MNYQHYGPFKWYVGDMSGFPIKGFYIMILDSLLNDA